MNKKLNSFNEFLKNKKIAVIGAGVSNISLFEYLNNLGCSITLFDNKNYDKLDSDVLDIIDKYNIETSMGNNYLEKLVGFDVIFRSPSCLPNNPYIEKEIERGCLVTTEVEQVIKLSKAPVIGITGSDGKTTTTTLINKLLEGLGYTTHLGGNIGKSLFTKIKDIKDNDIVVLELSSFQLMGMDISPKISVITNISPNHLDIHGDYEEYINAKKNIFLHQNKDGVVVLNYDDNLVKNFSNEAKGSVRYFSGVSKLENNYYLSGNYIMYNDDIIFDVRDLKIRGKHNYINVCTALNAIIDYITDIDKVKEIITNFRGVEHRLEFIRELNGVKWYNDSASSSPSRTIAGIMAYDEDITLIAGGYDKNIPYEPLAKPVIDKVRNLVLFGDTKNKIYDAVMELKRNSDCDLTIYVVDTLEEVIEVSYRVSKPGSVVLFSPASASFDMFKNAYQRGDIFKDLVNKL